MWSLEFSDTTLQTQQCNQNAQQINRFLHCTATHVVESHVRDCATCVAVKLSCVYVNVISTRPPPHLSSCNHIPTQVIMATNRSDTLDPALLRPGRLDRKIEFPMPDRWQKRLIFSTITSKMNLSEEVDLEDCILQWVHWVAKGVASFGSLMHPWSPSQLVYRPTPPSLAHCNLGRPFPNPTPNFQRARGGGLAQ